MIKSCDIIYVWLLLVRNLIPLRGLLQVFLVPPQLSVVYCKFFLHYTVKVLRTIKSCHYSLLFLLTRFSYNVQYLSFHGLLHFFICAVKKIILGIWLRTRFSCNRQYLYFHGLLQVFLAVCHKNGENDKNMSFHACMVYKKFTLQCAIFVYP